MIKFARTDRSMLSEWFWTVDHVILVGVGVLISIGLFLGLTASPPVADRLNLEAFHFMRRQLIFLAPGLVLLLATSMMSPRSIRRLGFLVFGVAMFLVICTLLFGSEIKGATRWLHFGPLALQPSEFLKPGFVIVTATILASGAIGRRTIPYAISIVVFAVTAGLLILQPDFGQTFLIVAVWSLLFFLSGVSRVWIVALSVAGIVGSLLAYQLVPHVQSRVDRFIDPASGDTYQIDRALDAFRHGGVSGQGIGEGEVKRILPDAHTDFVFAVAAEELGFFACLFLLIIFGLVVVRGFNRAFESSDAFAQLAITGMVSLFGMQAFVNMAVNMNLLPAKGMTLPFVSYGGSSLLALCLTMGMVLGLTRRGAKSINSGHKSRAAVRGVLQ